MFKNQFHLLHFSFILFFLILRPQTEPGLIVLESTRVCTSGVLQLRLCTVGYLKAECWKKKTKKKQVPGTDEVTVVQMKRSTSLLIRRMNDKEMKYSAALKNLVKMLWRLSDEYLSNEYSSTYYIR